MSFKSYLYVLDNKIIGAGCGKLIKHDGKEVINLETSEEIMKNWRDYDLDYKGQPVLSQQKIVEYKSAKIRAVRNNYLVKYVDPKQLFLVWNSLTDEDKAKYTSYRIYLLDYTKEPEWYEHNPKTFEEWTRTDLDS